MGLRHTRLLRWRLQVQRATAGVGKVAERWRAFGSLWKADRAAALAKFK